MESMSLSIICYDVTVAFEWNHFGMAIKYKHNIRNECAETANFFLIHSTCKL